MKGLLLTYTLLCGADAATTHIGLAHGYREAWLPTQNPAAVYVADGGAAALGWQLMTFEKTHPKLARGLAIGLIASRAAVVVHNARTLSR